MTRAMVERDAAIQAVRRLVEEAAVGRGRGLFVVGEAGQGKTAVVEHAVNLVGGRFRVGVGQADVAEAALPFGLVDQAVEQLGRSEALGPPMGGGSGSEVAAHLYAVIHALREAADEPLLLALEDAHWSDPETITLVRLLCRRIGSLPIALLVTARPWPPDALWMAEELAARGLVGLERLAPLSARAAHAMLEAEVGGCVPVGDIERAVARCAGNPLLLDHLASSLLAGQPLPEEGTGEGPWARRLLLSHLAGVDDEAQRYLRAAAVLGRRFRPEVAAQVARLCPERAAIAQEALAGTGLLRDGGEGWAEFSHQLVRQAVYDHAAPMRARLHEAAFRALLAHQVNPAEAAEHAVAARLVGDPDAVATLAQAGRQALAAPSGRLGATCWGQWTWPARPRPPS